MYVESSDAGYGLVKGKLSSWIVQFVDVRVGVVSINITFLVGDGEKQTSINTKRFNRARSFGCQILVFFEVMQTAATVLIENKY